MTPLLANHKAGKVLSMTLRISVIVPDIANFCMSSRWDYDSQSEGNKYLQPDDMPVFLAFQN